MALSTEIGVLLIFLRFPAATYVSRTNYAEITKDQNYLHMKFNIKRNFNTANLDPLGLRRLAHADIKDGYLP